MTNFSLLIDKPPWIIALNPPAAYRTAGLRLDQRLHRIETRCLTAKGTDSFFIFFGWESVRDHLLESFLSSFADKPCAERESPFAEGPPYEISASAVKSRVTGGEGYFVLLWICKGTRFRIMKTTIEIPETTLRRARNLAAAKGITLKQLVAEAIEEKVNNGGKTSKTSEPA